MADVARRADAVRRPEPVAAAVAAIACFAAAFAFASTSVVLTVVCYAVACVAALWIAARLRMRDDRRAVAFAIVVAVALRVPAFVEPARLSNDAYRYVWDGRLLRAGVDPHAVTPLSAAAAPLRRTWLWPHIDYRTIPTVYPPFALALFAVASLDERDLWGAKLVALTGEAALVAALLATLRARGLPRGRIAFYALQPLAALEFAGNAHIEAWAIAGIVAAVGARGTRSPLAPFALAAAVLTKIYPAVLAPIVFARDRAAFLTTVAVVALSYVPALARGHALGSSAHYLAVQRFNPSIGSLSGIGGLLVALGCVGYLAFRRARGGGDVALAALGVVLAYLLFATVVLPWYVLVLPALLCVVPRPLGMPLRPLAIGIAGWSCTAPIAYGAGWLWDEGGPLGIAMRCVEYAPIYAGLALVAWRMRRTVVSDRTAA